MDLMVRTLEEVTKAIQKAPCKQCDIHPVLTWLVKKFVDQLGPTITAMIGLSFMQGYFPASQKHAIVRPHLKKPSLDPLDIKSYQPILNISFISKLTERLVVERFNNHASAHHLLPAKQSVYRQYHSTETAITIVHNDIVRAIDAGNVSALVLLDLSAAFDTIDHDVLLDVLSKRFGVVSKALDWCKSCLSERTVFMRCVRNIEPDETYM